MLSHFRHKKRFTLILAVVFTLFSFSSTASAALVSTSTLVQEQQLNLDRQTLLATLDRQAVRSLLEKQGVDPEAVKLRVTGLTDEEVRLLNEKFEEMPAGGTDVLVIALVVFLVLLITDIVGWTDIFPFVKKNK